MVNFFDLHCDTLSKALNENKKLYENDLHISLKKAKKYNHYIQCFAVWIPDEFKGGAAMELFNRAYRKLIFEHENNRDTFSICKDAKDIENITNLKDRIGIILTVEGGAVLGGNIENVGYLRKKGVRMMTLTWNGSCEIGDGVGVDNARGLSLFGKKVVKKMEKSGIIVDISHASEKLFYDVCEISEKPFVATHSNSKKICSHRRNLKDEQFKMIAKCGGMVGINFCKDFLSDKGFPSFDDIIKHAEHFLELGGENTIAFGSDFDGCDVPDEISGIEYIENLYEYFLKKNYNQNVVDRIFFDNAYNFMINNL